VVVDERGALVELLADSADREIRVPVLAERAERRSEDGLTGVSRLRERVFHARPTGAAYIAFLIERSFNTLMLGAFDTNV